VDLADVSDLIEALALSKQGPFGNRMIEIAVVEDQSMLTCDINSFDIRLDHHSDTFSMQGCDMIEGVSTCRRRIASSPRRPAVDRWVIAPGWESKGG
jgi:hypothetical protein